MSGANRKTFAHAEPYRFLTDTIEKVLVIFGERDSVCWRLSAAEEAMMGRQTGDQSQLFYLFNLEELIPAGHLLRRINPVVTWVLADLREKLAPFYSDIGRPSIDPELMLRMLIVGYCYGIRFERRLCEEVELHLAYRWFCRRLAWPLAARAQQRTKKVPLIGWFSDDDAQCGNADDQRTTAIRACYVGRRAALASFLLNLNL